MLIGVPNHPKHFPSEIDQEGEGPKAGPGEFYTIQC